MHLEFSHFSSALTVMVLRLDMIPTSGVCLVLSPVTVIKDPSESNLRKSGLIWDSQFQVAVHPSRAFKSARAGGCWSHHTTVRKQSTGWLCSTHFPLSYTAPNLISIKDIKIIPSKACPQAYLPSDTSLHCCLVSTSPSPRHRG